MLTPSAILRTSQNYADEYGGVIYYKDTPTSVQCNFRANGDLLNSMSPLLPRCFLQKSSQRDYLVRIRSFHDVARKDGYFLYGGLLDKCQEDPDDQYALYFMLGAFFRLAIEKHRNITAKNITSMPNELLLCNNSDKNATYKNQEILRGQMFAVPLLALAQGKTTVSSQIIATTNGSRLRITQNTQPLPKGCSDLMYNLYSAEVSDHMILYLDGPCRDSGLAKVTINVTFLPCPQGFTQLGEVCVCEERLHVYNVECVINESAQIIKNNGSNFWMSTLQMQNGSYGGLILYDRCPAEYCKTQAVAFTLEDLDAQCDLNRSGVLCGQCASNYSLMLGSSRCGLCSSIFLALLLAFAAAGVALVAFLTFLKLTVATGTLNCLILYANIVQSNRSVFFPPNKLNMLTVFIAAWMNLDLGVL